MKVYLISGPARNGKDTIGDFLEKDYKEMGYKVCRTQIAKYLKMYIKDYFGWDGSEETKPRELLQRLGTDVIREKLGKERFFVDRTIEDIDILRINKSNFYIKAKKDCMWQNNNLLSDHVYRITFDILDRSSNDGEEYFMSKHDIDKLNDSMNKLASDLKQAVLD